MAELDQYGFRVGSLKSKAAALYSQGATREAVKAALGVTQLTVLQQLRQAGYEIKKTRVRVGKNRPHYSYRIMPKL